MKIFTLVQGIALFGAVALAMKCHDLGVGIVAFVIVQIAYGVPSIVLYVMRRVRNYNKRLAGMEAYRAQVFAQQYGSKTRTQPTYSAPRSQVYSIR